jgi:hypothetical protein
MLPVNAFANLRSKRLTASDGQGTIRRMPDKGPGSKGGAKKPKGGAKAASKNGKK